VSALNISAPALLGQFFIGVINGAFYALLSLGLAIIFGLLNIINFAQGALYMLGAFVAFLLLEYFGIGYWWALFISPLVVGLLAMGIERTLLRQIYSLDHLYSFILTLGIALVIQGALSIMFGASGQPYETPTLLQGGVNLGFMYLPFYRCWVVVIAIVLCFGTYWAIERTKLGATLRAATENPVLVQAFGIDVPRLITFTYGGGVALAALAGVLSGVINQVSPQMGEHLIVVVFAIVVIGGLGSIVGAIVSGFALGILEGLTRYIYPEVSNSVVFVAMAIVLLVKPAGLFGKEA
jgi:branched-chain amino acid transport system permease protein